MSVGRGNKIFFIISSVKNLLHRSSILFLIIVSILLLFLSKSKNDDISRFRIITLNYISPIVDFFVNPINGYYSFKEALSNVIFVYDDNEKLKIENKKLKEISDVVFFLKNENKKLKKQLNYIKNPKVQFYTARVIGDSSSIYKKQGIINAGEKNGIKKGQIVVSENNLIGRIQYVGKNSSKILFITDINSHIPIILSKSGINAVVAGNNSNDFMNLLYLSENIEVKVGESLYTSGDGLFFPSGIKVGTVSFIGKNNIKIKPAINLHNLDYARIIDISLVEDPETSDILPK